MSVGQLPDFAFRRSGHDRLAERRKDDAFLDAAWNEPHTRVLVMRGHDVSVDDAGNQLRFVSPQESPPGQRMLLGAVDAVTYFLVLVDTVADSSAGKVARTGGPTSGGPVSSSPAHSEIDEMQSSLAGEFSDLRKLVTELDPIQISLAVHAIALGGWHRRHPRCAACGARTHLTEGGASRQCPSCSTMHFPRTDPAVIMLVVDAEDRCLLGHNAARAGGWFSTLAGFVEPGEAPEEAVAREVREEAGIVVGDVTYAGSQPWPFPSSLMLGFFADAKTTEIVVDGDEITQARWFTRAELRDAVEAGDLVVPTTISIAGALIEHWYGGDMPTRRDG